MAIYSSHSDKNRLDMEICVSAITFTANNIVVSRNEDTHRENTLNKG